MSKLAIDKDQEVSKQSKIGCSIPRSISRIGDLNRVIATCVSRIDVDYATFDIASEFHFRALQFRRVEGCHLQANTMVIICSTTFIQQARLLRDKQFSGAISVANVFLLVGLQYEKYATGGIYTD